jgi:capsular polysaccharide export protein
MRGYFFGFRPWKRFWGDIRPFFDCDRFDFLGGDPAGEEPLERARKRGLGEGESAIYLWGRTEYPALERFAKEREIPLYRVEDGFVRSLGLGSDLTRPYSLVVDGRGIYFDPTQPSDLEHLLETAEFERSLLERAERLREYIVTHKLSKYNVYRDREIPLPGRHPGQEIALVPGQVEDDASIRYGADGMSNLELLRAARERAPRAYLVYKPHPDVLAGNRRGGVPEREARRYCDAIVTEASLDSVLARADTVHTMTSLVGFEALLRGKEVHTYGMPFYAGWGLTRDARRCARRTRRRSLAELVAATYLLYPRYLDPESGERCGIERTLEGLERLRRRYNDERFYRWRVDARNVLMRRAQGLMNTLKR